MKIFNYIVKIEKIEHKTLKQRITDCEEVIDALNIAFANNLIQLNKITELVEKLTDGN